MSIKRGTPLVMVDGQEFVPKGPAPRYEVGQRVKMTHGADAGITGKWGTVISMDITCGVTFYRVCVKGGHVGTVTERNIDHERTARGEEPNITEFAGKKWKLVEQDRDIHLMVLNPNGNWQTVVHIDPLMRMWLSYATTELRVNLK